MTDTATHTIVMTGASRGIGRIAAARLLRVDPRVHLVVVGRRPGPECDRATFVHADLANVSATREAVDTISTMLDAGELPPLDGLVGNAGIQYSNALTSTSAGLEATFAVNVVANHLLIGGLRRKMKRPSRIVITVSDTHFGDVRHNLGMVPAPLWNAPEVLARPGAFPAPESTSAGRTAYSTSKLAAIYLVHALARSLPHGVDIISFNPGFVPGTELARNADKASRFVMKRLMPVLTRTPIASTPSAAGAALADLVLGALDTSTGDYVDRRRVVRSSLESYDTDREAELVRLLESL